MNEFEKWLKTRPKCIQELAAKYPPGEYIMIKDAPYGLTCEGTIVTLYSYTEDGDVGVIVEAKNKTTNGLYHERKLAEKYGKEDKLQEFHNTPTRVTIHPKWMIKLKKSKQLGR